MKKMTKFFVGLMVIVLMVVLSACGAKVSTKMTVDSSFNGSRVITLNISNDDLGKVSGGIGALEKIIKEKKPDALSYTITDEASGKVITFTLEFKGIEDYRKKVTALINAGVTKEEKDSGDLLVPEVIYERNESYFKKGVVLKENFDSMNLLDWFREGIRSAKIISESESNWYEFGTTTLNIDGADQSSGSKIEYKNQENTCLSGCRVDTVIHVDNSISRTITFTAEEETVTALSGKGCTLESYFADLAPEGVEFKSEKEEGSYQQSYVFTINSDSAEDLTKKTNAILQTENNTLTVETTMTEDNLGHAQVAVSEQLDGSFYLDYNGYRSPLTSTLQVYNNVEILSAASGETAVPFENQEGTISYNPSATLKYDFTMDWQIEFSEMDLTIEPDGEDQVKVELACGFSEDLSAEMKGSAVDRIKSYIESKDNYTAKADQITLTFSGKTEDVETQINRIVAAANGDAPEELDNSYFHIVQGDYNTGSFLTDGKTYDVNYNFAPLIGKAQLSVEEESSFFGSTYFQGDVYRDDEGALYVKEAGAIAIYQDNFSIMSLIIFGASGLAALIGLILLLLGIKPLKKFLAAKKQAKKEAKAAAPAPVAPEMPAAPSVPAAPIMETPAMEAPAAENAPQEELPAEDPSAEQELPELAEQPQAVAEDPITAPVEEAAPVAASVGATAYEEEELL